MEPHSLLNLSLFSKMNTERERDAEEQNAADTKLNQNWNVSHWKTKVKRNWCLVFKWKNAGNCDGIWNMNKDLQHTIKNIQPVKQSGGESHVSRIRRCKFMPKSPGYEFTCFYCWYGKWHFLALKVGFEVPCKLSLFSTAMVLPFYKPLCGVSCPFCLL